MSNLINNKAFNSVQKELGYKSANMGILSGDLANVAIFRGV